jgi:hypothetical protein
MVVRPQNYRLFLVIKHNGSSKATTDVTCFGFANGTPHSTLLFKGTYSYTFDGTPQLQVKIVVTAPLIV